MDSGIPPRPVPQWYIRSFRHMEDTLQIRYQIPALTFRTLDGRDVSAWDFKQKRNRVIAFLCADSPQTWDFVKQVVAHAADWKEKEAVGLIVFEEAPRTGLPAAMPPEVIAGTDARGGSIARFLGPEALRQGGLERQGVFVADRYGELYAKWVIGKNGELPAISEILKALEQIEIACEECHPTTWALDG
jgi:hypothetical protein